MIITHRINLPHGWRIGIVIMEGDVLTAWLLHGEGDYRRSAQIEELLYAHSVPELTALALRKIAGATVAL